MTPNPYYFDSALAESYDAIEQSLPIVTDDIPFYVDLAREASAAGQSVLELGCGTGRVTLPIARAGARVTGIDAAPEMLDVARRKSAVSGLEVTWVQGDMASFRLEERFGLVIIPFRSFLMLLSVDEQKSCLGCIRENLVDGGRLALNIFNPSLPMMAAWMTGKRGTWERDSRYPRDAERQATREYHTATQELHEREADILRDPAGAVVSRTERDLRLRYIFRYEMEHLLALTGFEVEALYGWFDRRPFDDDSDEMVWVARKA